MYQALEVVRHEGLDGYVWYVVFELKNDARVRELVRTRKLTEALEVIERNLA